MPATKFDAASEIAWLIELPQHARPGEPPTYWGWVDGQEGWTRDVNDAIRYASEAQADKAAAVYCDDYVIVEHAWSLPQQVRGDQS